MSLNTGWLRDSVAWGTVGAVVLAAHVGGAVWLMNKAEASQIAGLPDPVYVDLAPMPEADAPPAEEETFDQQESVQDEPEPEPEAEPVETAEVDFTPPPLPELEPLPDMSTLFAANDAVVLERSERPPERPEPQEKPEEKIVEKKKEEPKKEPPKEPKKTPPPSQASTRTTRVEAPQGARTAAPNANVGSAASPRQVASWNAKVNAAVHRHMSRTRVGNKRAGFTAMINFKISANGTVSGVRLINSSGDPAIDAAVARRAASLPNMPPPPSGQGGNFNLPVEINLR